MGSLFLDSSFNIAYGLLDSDNKWIDYSELPALEGSSSLHHKIFEMLEKNTTDINSVENIFAIAGPGSYTGMRLSEGFSQITEIKNKKVYSFYHFDIPELLEVDKFAWVSNAFKGETFVYIKNGSKVEKSIYPNSEFEEHIKAYDIYSHESKYLSIDTISSKELLKTRPEDIISKVTDISSRKGPFYYRDVEKEFKLKK